MEVGGKKDDKNEFLREREEEGESGVGETKKKMGRISIERERAVREEGREGKEDDRWRERKSIANAFPIIKKIKLLNNKNISHRLVNMLRRLFIGWDQ